MFFFMDNPSVGRNHTQNPGIVVVEVTWKRIITNGR